MELEPPRHHRATAKAPTHPQHDPTSEQQRFCKPKEGHTPKQTLEMASNDGFAKQAATVFEKNAFSWRDRTALHAICALHVCKPFVGCHAPPQSRSTQPRIFAEPSQNAILPRKIIVSVLPISQKRHRTPFAARKRTTAPWRGGVAIENGAGSKSDGRSSITHPCRFPPTLIQRASSHRIG